MPLSQNDCANAQAEYDDCIGNGQTPGFCLDFVEDGYPGFQNCGGNGGGSGLTDYWNNPNNWIDFTSGLTGIVGGIIGMANGQPVYATTQQTQQADNSTVWWIVGAVALLLVILLLVVIFKK